MLWACDTCPRQFGSNNAAVQHMNAVNHWGTRYKCQTCNFSNRDEIETYQHMDDFNHWKPQFNCEACGDSFWTNAQAISHMNSHNHWRKHWCGDCQRGFQNENNLRQHLHGAAHLRGSISYPFYKKPHTTASGVVHHVETDSCPNAKNVNRETIYSFINRTDTTGIITNKQLTWHSHENNDYVANSASWNGRTYECYLCHKTFGSLISLNKHLSSNAHKQKIYHCFGRNCGKQFSALAQLFNHLESESCGAMRFNQVQKNAAGILTGQRMIGF